MCLNDLIISGSCIFVFVFCALLYLCICFLWVILGGGIMQYVNDLNIRGWGKRCIIYFPLSPSPMYSMDSKLFKYKCKIKLKRLKQKGCISIDTGWGQIYTIYLSLSFLKLLLKASKLCKFEAMAYSLCGLDTRATSVAYLQKVSKFLMNSF